MAVPMGTLRRCNLQNSGRSRAAQRLAQVHVGEVIRLASLRGTVRAGRSLEDRCDRVPPCTPCSSAGRRHTQRMVIELMETEPASAAAEHAETEAPPPPKMNDRPSAATDAVFVAVRDVLPFFTGQPASNGYVCPAHMGPSCTPQQPCRVHHKLSGARPTPEPCARAVRSRHARSRTSSYTPAATAAGGNPKPKESRRAEKEEKGEKRSEDPFSAGAALEDDAAWGPAGSAAVALSAAADKAKDGERDDARAAKSGDRGAAGEGRRVTSKGGSSRRSATRDAPPIPPSVPPKRAASSTRLAAVAEAAEVEAAERERAERRVSASHDSRGSKAQSHNPRETCGGWRPVCRASAQPVFLCLLVVHLEGSRFSRNRCSGGRRCVDPPLNQAATPLAAQLSPVSFGCQTLPDTGRGSPPAPAGGQRAGGGAHSGGGGAQRSQRQGECSGRIRSQGCRRHLVSCTLGTAAHGPPRQGGGAAPHRSHPAAVALCGPIRARTVRTEPQPAAQPRPGAPA